MAALKNPSAIAVVPGPSPNAKVVRLLLQWPPLPSLMLMPKMPMHVFASRDARASRLT